ncbi:aminopeptidase [Desulfovibrio mangrovi]|uniref:aminopeptidase n=1 Tax=Desulfovibrio mangrovi TaxID=2976983 RepID=UPI0022475B75|nr:aminopeptidase [Desulfovibrio mangrovi]UZP69100.1 aminopeptidase [Desulfovibrio mangrovi]
MTDNLELSPKSCWEIYGDEASLAAMDELAGRYIDFLSTCKTERETIDYVVERLRTAGYTTNFGHDLVYRVFKGKTIFIARKGKRSLSQGLRLVGAHADTPRVDLKQRPLYEACGVGQAKTHYYGGIRKHQWFSRPLALHGVIVRQDGEVKKVNIGEDPGDPVFAIADLLPHLAQNQAKQVLSEAFEAEKMNIILGHRPVEVENGEEGESKDAPKEKIKRRVLELLNAKYDIREEDLYSAELQAVPAGPARLVGLDGAIIGGYGQDDRICCFAALEALLTGDTPEFTQTVLLWDKEEIGSEGSTGAKSRFFEYCVEDLIQAWAPAARFSDVMLNTKAVSADVHGALDPDYQDLHEKLNSATIGYGPCFCKFTGHRGKYEANDAHPEYVGWLRGVLNTAGVPWQMAELGRVDLGGGGTVAMYLAAYGMDIIDFGPPILAMHSPFELSSKADLYATVKAYTAFMQA